ncbi:MAG: hypothetical protein LBS41_00260 [Streptococcaceae bacterium]|jgi:hypothetical protein|nr:hypothetical protein [Streptococcaceae bacterium]
MKLKTILGTLAVGVILLTSLSPVANVVLADEVSQSTSTVSNDASGYKVEAVAVDEQGIEYPYNPSLRFNSSVISIGIKLTLHFKI